MYFALVFGFFVFLSAALVFQVLAKQHHYFRYLALLAGIQAVDFLLYFLPEGIFPVRFLQIVLFGSYFWFGPLFYLFGLGVLKVNVRHSRWLNRHLIAATILAFAASCFYLLALSKDGILVNDNWLDVVSVPLPIAIFAGYQIVLLLRYENTRWQISALPRAILGLAVLSVVTVLLHLLLLFNWLDDIWRLIIPAVFALALYVFFIYVAFKFGDFKRFFARQKTRTPTLSVVQHREITQLIHDYLNNEQRFKNNQLKVAEVAMAIGVNEKQLSEAINIEKGMSFQNLVNQIRLNYVTEQLSDNKEVNLLDLALEAGFGSKSAFNRSFKAQFGQPPSQWRAQRQTQKKQK